MNENQIRLDLERILLNQKRCGRLLMKEIKKDPPNLHKKSLVGWSDTITTHCLNELIKDKNTKIKNVVHGRALDYAKSIIKYKDYLYSVIIGKSEKEKKVILALTLELKNKDMKKTIDVTEASHWSNF